MSLKQKTLYGILWTFADAFLVKGLSFIAMLFLARWLGPNDFGLMGMMAVFIGLGTALVDSGLSASIIRTPDADNRDFTTIFYVNLIISLVVYTLLFFSAPYVAVFFNQEVLGDVIRIYCLIFIITAFSSVQLAILQKEMRFKRLTLLNIPSTIIGTLVGLVMGYIGYGVWSIVVMYITTQAVLSVLLWVTTNWRPTFLFSKERLVHHYKFGYKLMLSSLLNTFFNNSYHMVIGKFFPVQTLGFYERAQRFNEYPAMTITSIVEKVTYPMLSKLQEDMSRLSNIYRKLLKITFFITAPLMLGVAAMAKPLFQLVLGSEWLPAVPYFQILSMAYMLYPLHAFNLNVLKVYGRSDLFLKLEIIKKVIIVLGVILGLQFGIIGLLWSAVASSFITLFVNMYYSSRLINYSVNDQVWDMFPNLIVAIVTGLLIFFVVNILGDYSYLIQLFGAMISGILFYIFVYSFVKNGPMYLLLNLIKKNRL